MTADLPDHSDIARQKQILRRESLARRRSQPNKDALSARACGQLFELPEFLAANCVVFYASARSELRTLVAITRAIAIGKQVGVPFCQGSELQLFSLAAVDDLTPGAYNILEPHERLKALTERSLSAGEVDLIVVPAVAFDPRGARLGHGQGYYDRLLARLPPEVRRIGLAFECQIVPTLPTTTHDERVDIIITEETVYRCERP